MFLIYTYDNDSSEFFISDINECVENPRICLNGRCENTPGSYHCICQSGFTPSRDSTFCVDMDECSTSGMCEHGKCVNMEGSFKCVCDSGFRIGPDQSHCIGIDSIDIINENNLQFSRKFKYLIELLRILHGRIKIIPNCIKLKKLSIVKKI